MAPYYRICVLGDTEGYTKNNTGIENFLNSSLKEFDLKLGNDVEIVVGENPALDGSDHISTVVLYWGKNPAPIFKLPDYIQDYHPIVPVVSKTSECSKELPNELSVINAMELNSDDSEIQIATVLLECLGLIREKRRLFISYRREKANQVALQLFDKLSAKQFSIFLDTHIIRPGNNFQDILWHNLSDSDLMIILETEDYFDSTWTTEEYVKAIELNLGILRLIFPGVLDRSYPIQPKNISLTDKDFDENELLINDTLKSIIEKIEMFRSLSIAAGISKLDGELRRAATSMNADIKFTGKFHQMQLELTSNKVISIYPITGVPNAELLNKLANDANANSLEKEFAIMYDDRMVTKDWINHLSWLEQRVKNFRWLLTTKLANQLVGFQNEK